MKLKLLNTSEDTDKQLKSAQLPYKKCLAIRGSALASQKHHRRCMIMLNHESTNLMTSLVASEQLLFGLE
ncbi:hypothetical protein H9L39_11381 [Fusarium oxysporum f. sp. albedinis]|nr:hypothetical protein H9L39_11381 [Fusarium oxysporum f. sp. albedinis]